MIIISFISIPKTMPEIVSFLSWGFIQWMQKKSLEIFGKWLGVQRWPKSSKDFISLNPHLIDFYVSFIFSFRSLLLLTNWNVERFHSFRKLNNPYSSVSITCSKLRQNFIAISSILFGI